MATVTKSANCSDHRLAADLAPVWIIRTGKGVCVAGRARKGSDPDQTPGTEKGPCPVFCLGFAQSFDSKLSAWISTAAKRGLNSELLPAPESSVAKATSEMTPLKSGGTVTLVSAAAG